MEMNPTHVCVKLGVTYAYPSMSWTAVLEVLKTEPELRQMTWSFVARMVPPTDLESAGEKWSGTGDGLLQGKPSSSGYFCVGRQPELKQINHEGSTEGGVASVIADDGYITCYSATVFLTVQRFEDNIRQCCSFHLNRSKTKVFTGGSACQHPARPQEGRYLR